MPINSSSIPALTVARNVRRKRRADGGNVFPLDLRRVYVGQGGDDNVDADRNIPYDPMTGVQIGGQMSPEPAPASSPQSTTSRMLSRLTGTQFGEPRHQLWPEKMVRSGVSLAGDVLSGKQEVVPPGLRREDYTDKPKPGGWEVAAQPNDPMMERAQDMAGLAGGQTLLTGAREALPASQRALVAAADSQATGAPLAALEHAPKFYSGLERAVEAIPQPAMTGQQWLGTLTNRGVKAEEMQWSGLGQYLTAKADQPVSKAEVAQHLGSNKLELGETVYGQPPAWDRLTNEQQWAVTDKFIDLNDRPPRGGELPEWYQNVADHAATGRETALDSIIKPTRYSDYQLPGGENYSEKLLTLPEKSAHQPTFDQWLQTQSGMQDGPMARATYMDAMSRIREASEVSPSKYRSSHWEEPNVLAHRRSNERTYDIPFTPEEAAAVQAHEAAKPKIEAIRRQQDEVSRQIRETVKPLERTRQDKIRADIKSGAISGPDGLRQLEAYVEHPEIKPLQDRLEALRAAEIGLLPDNPLPKPKTGRALHIEEIQSDWHQAGRKKGYRGVSDKFDTTGMTAQPVER